MSKELKALDIIRNIGLYHMETSEDENYDGEWEYTDYEEYDGTIEENYPKEIKILETALKEKIELEEENKALIESNDLLNEALIEDQQKLKVLEIIKDKKVNLEYLKCCENYEQYKTVCSYWNEITQEDFDLLKEEL